MKEKNYYKKLIIEMIENIDNVNVLIKIYTTVKHTFRNIKREGSRGLILSSTHKSLYKVPK